MTVLVVATAPGEGRVETAPISPSYGVEREARRLVVSIRARAPLAIGAFLVAERTS